MNATTPVRAGLVVLPVALSALASRGTLTSKMVTRTLLLAAAQHILGIARSSEITDAAHAALDQGVYSDSLGRLVTSDGFSVEEAGRLLEKALRELRCPLPDREMAMRLLLLECIGGIGEDVVPPRDGVSRLYQDFYIPVVVGQNLAPDSQGIDKISRWYWCYDEVESCPDLASVNGQFGPDAIEELNRMAVEDARRWIEDHAPFVDPTWLVRNGGIARQLADHIQHERRFDDLPVLAEALQAAGCESTEILCHCREPGPHRTSCWVVDLLLKNEP